MNQQDYISKIEDDIQEKGFPDGDLLKDILTDAMERQGKQRNLYERYKQSESGVPIFQRQYVIDNIVQTDKINNKLANDFFGEIVDDKVGFLVGNPISYMINKSFYEKKTLMKRLKGEIKSGLKPIAVFEQDTDILSNWVKVNNLADLDAETVKKAAICGEFYRLMYIQDNELKIMKLDPWECLVLTKSDIWEPEYALRQYLLNEIDHVDLYDKTNVYQYEQDETGYYAFKGKNLHMFAGVPLIGFANNEELSGDCDKALSLIDAYDRILSDVDNEIEQFRLAYMAIMGGDIEKDAEDAFVTKLLQTGTFFLPDGTEAKFITKTIQIDVIEKILKRIEDNIYRFTKTVNYNDEKFSGNVTGIALRQKMMQTKNKCKMTERKLVNSLREMFRLVTSYWKLKGTADVDYLSIDFGFTYNFPVNLTEEAEIQERFDGRISDRTRLGLLSFIDDPDDEMELMQQEGRNIVSLDDKDVRNIDRRLESFAEKELE